jgi:hypothetical protein
VVLAIANTRTDDDLVEGFEVELFGLLDGVDLDLE